MDFAVSLSGDLILEEQQQSNRLAIEFRIADNPGLVIDFHMLGEPEAAENKGMMISFVQGEKSDLTYKGKVIEDIEEKIQLIRLSLMTELGQLPRRTAFGSKLLQQRHQDIHDVKNLSIIKSTTEEIARKILSNPTVSVAPGKGSGNLYFHNVEIRIYEDNIQIFKFHI